MGSADFRRQLLPEIAIKYQQTLAPAIRSVVRSGRTDARLGER
jgi:hypothetical protein